MVYLIIYKKTSTLSFSTTVFIFSTYGLGPWRQYTTGISSPYPAFLLTSHCSKHGMEYVSGDNCLPVCLELDDDRWDKHFMADIAGAQECNNEDEDEEGRNDSESDREDQPAIPQLKSFKEAIASLEQVQRFLECHGMSVEANALSSTIDRIAAVAINAMVQTTLHD